MAILVRRWWVCVLCVPWMLIGNTPSFIALSLVIILLGYRSLRLEPRAGLYSFAGLLLISVLAFLPDLLSESTNQVFDFLRSFSNEFLMRQPVLVQPVLSGGLSHGAWQSSNLFTTKTDLGLVSRCG